MKQNQIDTRVSVVIFFNTFYFSLRKKFWGIMYNVVPVFYTMFRSTEKIYVNMYILVEKYKYFLYVFMSAVFIYLFLWKLDNA